MGKVDMKAVFAGFDPAQYAEEAGQRWGETEAYKVSAERTKSYAEAAWKAIKEEQSAIFAAAREALAAGVSPEDPRAMDVAERHRLSIERWFYPCSPKMHRGLADLLEADRRYAQNSDKHAAALTAFLAATVRANAQRAPSCEPGERSCRKRVAGLESASRNPTLGRDLDSTVARLGRLRAARAHRQSAASRTCTTLTRSASSTPASAVCPCCGTCASSSRACRCCT